MNMKKGKVFDGIKNIFIDAKKRKLFIIITAIALTLITTAVALCCVFLLPENQPVTIKVTYYGFNNEKKEVEIKSNEKYEIPVLEDLQYYTFEGWYLDEKLTMPIETNFFDDYHFNSNISFYSKWGVINPVKLTFEEYGGSLVADVNVPRGAPIDKSWFSEKEGCSLLGWCYDANLTTVFMPGDSFTENTTLYAKWILKEITDDDTVNVIFQVNGGTSVENVTIKMGQTVELPAPNRVGYDFLGWYSDENYKYPFNTNVVLVQSIVLYAKWEENNVNYNINFDTRGGDAIERLLRVNGSLITVSTLPSAVKAEDEFLYWCTDEGCLNQLTTDFYIKNNVTLYAKYKSDEIEPIEYVNIFYNLYEGNVQCKSIQKNTKMENWTPNREGYTFIGWYKNSNYTIEVDFSIFAYEETTLYAKWSKDAEYSDNYFNYTLSNDKTYLIVEEEKDKSLTSVVIPATCNGLPIKEIKDNLFKGRILNSVTIGENVEIIGTYAFSESQITSITIPSKVKIVEEKAFYKANKLASVTIDGETEIGANAFESCTSLTTVKASKVKIVNDNAFLECIKLESVDFRNVETLGDSAFKNCSALETVDITNSTLEKITVNCFINTSSLKSINFPTSLKEIETKAFYGSGLTSINLKNVESVNVLAFANNNSLSIIEIGEKLSDMKANAFLYNESISEFRVDSNNQTFSAYNKNLYNKDKTTLIIVAPKNTNNSVLIIPKTLKKIEGQAFGCVSNVEEVQVESENEYFKTVDGNLYSIDGKIMYYYASNQNNDTFTTISGVTEIYSFCFVKAKNLEKIILSSEIVKANLYSFYNMDNLQQIVYKNQDLTLNEGEMGEVYLCENVEIKFEE